MLAAQQEEAKTLLEAKQGYGPHSKDEDYSQKLHAASDAKLSSVFMMLGEIYREVGECLVGAKGAERKGD